MAFSNTIKCPDCGTIYYKGQGHVCPVPCEDCGVKIYSETHSCDPKKVEDRLIERFKSELRGGELTPRMKNHVLFLQWCRENDRL